MSNLPQALTILVIGSPDFGRQVQTLFPKLDPATEVKSALLAEAWSQALSLRPHLLMAEVGIHHDARSQALLRSFLTQLRERLGTETYVTIALQAPQRFGFGGDLLFEADDSLAPSGLVDSFLASSGNHTTAQHDLGSQLSSLLAHVRLELQRRALGAQALPALNTRGWVQSLADPVSRELWMRWLPRYASYTTENPVLIGETGSGKTNLAYAIHLLSGRKGKFVSMTPRDFSSSELIQAELFGSVPGAYTGATERWGLVHGAEGGTLFIDELQSIDKELQGKLITFIEHKAYRRVGASETIDADVRFVFAANKTLERMRETEILRDDFAYRLERVQLRLPPLTERRLDIAAGLAYALAKVKRQRPNTAFVLGLTPEAYRLLSTYSWPGNLRQLENCVARLCELADVAGHALVTDLQVVAVLPSHELSDENHLTRTLNRALVDLKGCVARGSVKNLEEATALFRTLSRGAALDLHSGDAHAAANTLGEAEELLAIFAEQALAKRTER